MESWLFLENDRCPPAWNMACDEWLLIHAERFAQPILRMYGWDRPSVTIGYFQPFPTEIPKRYTVIRRPTGGALVVHDSDLTFTVILPPDHSWRELSVFERYEWVHARIGKVFESKGIDFSLADQGAALSVRGSVGSHCFQKSSRYDVLVSGMKVAGGAQRITRKGLLHQGSIQGEGSPRVSPEELRRAWQTCGARFTDLNLTPNDETSISDLATCKFATDAWNRRI